MFVAALWICEPLKPLTAPSDLCVIIILGLDFFHFFIYFFILFVFGRPAEHQTAVCGDFSKFIEAGRRGSEPSHVYYTVAEECSKIL